MKAKAHKDKEQGYCAAPDAAQDSTQLQGEFAERRKTVRLNRHFSAKFCKVGVYFPVEGIRVVNKREIFAVNNAALLHTS